MLLEMFRATMKSRNYRSFIAHCVNPSHFMHRSCMFRVQKTCFTKGDSGTKATKYDHHRQECLYHFTFKDWGQAVFKRPECHLRKTLLFTIHAYILSYCHCWSNRFVGFFLIKPAKPVHQRWKWDECTHPEQQFLFHVMFHTLRNHTVWVQF